MIPQATQLPLYEPMYINGQLSPTWAMFFEKLAQLLNQAQIANLIELMQRASQLPDQSKQGQISIEMDDLQNYIEQVKILPTSTIEPTLQSVFLCPESAIDVVCIPNLEVISP